MKQIFYPRDWKNRKSLDMRNLFNIGSLYRLNDTELGEDFSDTTWDFIFTPIQFHKRNKVEQFMKIKVLAILKTPKDQDFRKLELNDTMWLSEGHILEYCFILENTNINTIKILFGK